MSVLRRPACGRHRDMRHWRIRPGAMPVALAGLDVHHVAYGDLALLGFAGDDPPAGGDDEYLIAVMHVPAGRRSNAEIHDVAAKLFGLPVADNFLPRAAHRTAGPSGDRRRRAHRFLR